MRIITLESKDKDKEPLFCLGETCFINEVQYKCIKATIELWNCGTNIRTTYYLEKRNKKGEFPQ